VAVGVHEAGVEPLAGAVHDLLPLLRLEIGADGGDNALPHSDVRLVGLPIDSVVYRTVFQKHVTSLPSKNICL